MTKKRNGEIEVLRLFFTIAVLNLYQMAIHIQCFTAAGLELNFFSSCPDI